MLRRQAQGFSGGSVVKSRPAMQEMLIWSLIWQDPTYCGAAESMYNYWACDLQPRGCNYHTHVMQLLKPVSPRIHAPQQEKPLQWDAQAPQLESNPHLPQPEKSLPSNSLPRSTAYK